MLDQVAVPPPVNGAGTLPSPAVPEPCTGAGRVEWEAALRQWLDTFLATAPTPAELTTFLASNVKRQHRFIGYGDGERFEVQAVEPDIKDPNRKYNEQSNKFAYTDTIGRLQATP